MSPRRRIGDPDRVLILIEGDDDGATTVATARELELDGFSLRREWADPGGDYLDLSATQSICIGSVACREDAEAAIASAVAGFGVVAQLTAPGEVVAAFHEDLRRVGPVEWRDREWLEYGLGFLDPEQRTLLALLSGGCSLAEAGHRLGYSRRTIDRRLASIRRALGVGTTAEALTRFAEAHSRARRTSRG